VILTDQDNEKAFIADLAPQAIGVADQPFVWRNVPPPPNGSDHYCLFAQLNNELNQNPFPEVYTQIDMAALLKNNLGWGWRNTRLIPGTRVDTFYTQRLTIPADITSGTTKYFVYVSPEGFLGWTVSFTCSRADSKGKPIELKPRLIDQDGLLLGTKCYLDPGFDAVVDVYLNANGRSASPGATMPLTCAYETAPGAEEEEALRRGLEDRELDTRLRSSLSDVGPTAHLVLGSNPYAVTTR